MEFRKTKPSRNPDELLAKLKSRNLTVSEEDELLIKNSIRTIGYYRLSGYFGPFQDKKDEFVKGVTFSDILGLYEFDRKLRQLTSPVLKAIEIELKARLTDIYSAAYESDWYANKDLFILEKRVEYIDEPTIEGDNIVWSSKKIEIPKYQSLIKDIKSKIKRNEDKEYIIKFRSDYGESTIPSWMMMECISFGLLSRLFSLLKDSPEKKLVSRHFGILMPEMFTSQLHGFVILRNACAHHARIWNKKITGDLALPNRPSAKFLDESNKENLRKFYGVSGCLLKTLEKTSPTIADEYKTGFYKLVCENKIKVTAMGFPENFEVNDVWKV